MSVNFGELVAAVEAELTSEAIKHAKLGAVNWGDLRVVEIEERREVYPALGSVRLVVLIEEASPSCTLAQWLHERLKYRFPNIEYQCAW
jgi:hypothetical protein